MAYDKREELKKRRLTVVHQGAPNIPPDTWLQYGRPDYVNAVVPMPKAKQEPSVPPSSIEAPSYNQPQLNLGYGPQDLMAMKAKQAQQAQPEGNFLPGEWRTHLPTNAWPAHSGVTVPEPQQQTQLKPTADLFAMLAGGSSLGSSVPRPEFSVPQTNFPFPKYEPFQSPGYSQQIFGGDLREFLSRPNAVQMALPMLNSNLTFGLTPQTIQQIFDTNLQYAQALQAQRQQDYTNRLAALQQAQNLDKLAQDEYSQKYVDATNAFNLLNAETPQQARTQEANIKARLAEYENQLKLDQLLTTAKVKLQSGDLSEGQKIQLQQAWKVVDEVRKSIPAKDFSLIISGQADPAEIINTIMQSGGSVRTAEMVATLPWAISTLQQYGQISSAKDVGADLTPEEKPIDIRDYVKQLKAGKSGK